MRSKALRPRMTLLAVVLLATGCTGGQLPKVSGEAAEELGLAIDVLVLEYLENRKVPGATVAVTKNGRLVLSKGYGVADLSTGKQMEPEHRTLIGSVSKVITAIAFLQLVEQGDVGLDDHLYASSVTPLWGSDPEAEPGLIHASDGVIENAGDYLLALTKAPKNIPKPETGGLAEPGMAWWWPPSYLLKDTYPENVSEILDWATSIRIKHVLSHTAGFLRSGDTSIAEEEFGTEEGPDDEEGALGEAEDTGLTYPQLHEAMMTGANGPPFRFKAGAGRAYSNHGFGLTGQLIAELSESSYVDYTTANILEPLGLFHVVPRDLVDSYGDRDAARYRYAGDKKDGDPVPPLAKYQPEQLTQPTISVSTGGWSATARDLVRVMCGLDVESNNLRLLSPETANTMATVAYPQAGSKQPLGWDERTGTPALTKDGVTPRGGGARITKYLPGSNVSDAEINVAVATNKNVAPPTGLLREIAKVAAAAEIPEDYDLFEEPYRCRTTLGLAAPASPTPSPSPTPTLTVVQSPSPTPAPTATLASSPSPTPTPTRTPPRPRVSAAVEDDDIWEFSNDMECGPTTTEVSATVTGGSTIRSVRMEWDVEGSTGSRAMRRDGPNRWIRDLGPFDSRTVGHPSGSAVEIKITVTDDLGRTATTTTAVTLYPCPPIPQ